MHDDTLAVCLEKWKQVDRHIQESVDFRDRLKTVELRVILLEKQVLRNAIVGGIIGSLIGAGATPAVTNIINILLKVS